MSSSHVNKIDWSRMAEPQPDGYDSDVVLSMVGDSAGRLPHHVEHTCFGGMIAVRHIGTECPYDPPIINAPVDHPHIADASEFVRLWQNGYLQIRRLIHTFHPLWDSTVPLDNDTTPLSSCSGAKEECFGCIFATVENPLTLAEAFVHETAHNKLFGLGVSLESSSRLITNSPDCLYESPVIRDRMRPMQAVFHATYTFTHILALNVAIADSLPKSDLGTKQNLMLMSANLPTVERGLELVSRNIETDIDGALFLKGFRTWANELCEQSNEVLKVNGLKRIPIEPLAYTR